MIEDLLNITISDVLLLLLFFAPAFVANAMPVIAQHIPGVQNWTTPIDEKSLGSHKTYRGLAFGMAGGILTGWLVIELARFFGFQTFFTLIDMLAIAALMSFGALMGDIAESAFKRAIKIAPGKPLPVLDGIDYMVGAMIFVMPFYIVEWYEIIILLFVGPILSLVSNIIAYMLGWKKVWY